MVHEHGGQVYLDGANLNAQVCLLLKLITFHSFVTGNFFQMCPVLQRFFFSDLDHHDKRSKSVIYGMSELPSVRA